jgi:N6-L-threonylcarbamoyladenine synthase
MKYVLGIETSCDETSAAVIKSSCDINDRILSNVILSQTDEHIEYGGVVPEIAARAHLHYLPNVVQKSLKDANISLTQLSAIAVTSGPGLIGGVLVGVGFASALASSLNIPCYGINHLEGHALTPRLSNNVEFPYLLLLASGGHCQFIEVKDFGKYHLLGETIDDAAGEAFDKTAKLLNLPYPGGPEIEKSALLGDEKKYDLPKPLVHRPDCQMSFSGLKTAVRNVIQAEESITPKFAADVSASFQYAVASVFCKKLQRAIESASHRVERCVIAGGVAANKYISQKLRDICQQQNITFVSPPLSLCTDNAAMIGWVGMEMIHRDQAPTFPIRPQPRWPLAHTYHPL